MTRWDVCGPDWATSDSHRQWLEDRARRLFDFYSAAYNPSGGFYDLDERREPLPTGWPPASSAQTSLFQTTRMVHSYAIGHLWGRPDCGRLVEHGMDHLWGRHRDATHGGYYWIMGADGPIDDSKQIYGHAFVLLAASTATVAGHPDAGRLLADVSEVIESRFWEPDRGAAAEEFDRDWSGASSYRGANGNMHLVEALLAAFEATGESVYLDRAESVAQRIIGTATASNDWRVPEHFDRDWRIDRDYDRDVFRPYGSTIGHWLEWSRLLLQLWVACGSRDDWMREASVRLFDGAMTEGWDAERGGFYFTVGWDGAPVDRDRYWWPCTEGIAAAYWLGQHMPDERYESAYRQMWSWAAEHLITDEGFWRHQLDDALSPKSDPWFGAPDVYHSLQATLIPTVAARGSLTHGLATLDSTKPEGSL